MTKVFKVPFATQGDRVSIPVETQVDGSVSYTQGYGYDYERDQTTDPAAKDIEREKMNDVFHDITEATGEMQVYGAAKWSIEGKPYPLMGLVYHDNKMWQSKIANNNDEPAEGSSWHGLKADISADLASKVDKTQISDSVASSSSVTVASSKAVKTAYDLAASKLSGVPDGTTTQKGLVQLSSSTNFDNETLAATPKAVKAVSDKADAALLAANSKVVSVNGKQGVVTLSASDVDAVSASKGGHYGGAISATYTESNGFGYQYATAAPFYNTVTRAPNSEFWPVVKQQFHIPGHSAYTYTFGVLNGGDGSQDFKLHIINSSGTGTMFSWSTNGDYHAPGSLRCGAHVYAAYHLYAGGGNAYLRNDGMVAGPVWGGTINGWMYANFVSGVRFAGRVNIADTGGRIDLPSGAVYNGMSGANYNPAYWGAYTHLQYLINGQWVNAGTV
ncbi:phage tail protein [Limnobaculum xujianqingii]|uniref:phage tail protein n=1 Tax=Limnobaculum xujianqingii TaxID=2738837 RepID=UPI0015C174E0|nr:phage tail protein [Limnobaculum xujianqingii]